MRLLSPNSSNCHITMVYPWCIWNTVILLSASLYWCCFLFVHTDGVTTASSLVTPPPVMERSIHDYGDWKQLSLSWMPLSVPYNNSVIIYHVTISYNDYRQTTVRFWKNIIRNDFGRILVIGVGCFAQQFECGKL